jgi:acetyl-CoA synthetase
MFEKWGEEWIKKHDLSTLRILGTVGEPIDYDAWMWYFNIIGGGRCPIIDTWWQTETGGTLINAFPGIGPFVPSVAGRGFPGTEPKILDDQGKETDTGLLVQSEPFPPGLLRNVYRDPQRYKDTYFSQFGEKYYFTGDGARIFDDLGEIRLTGRVDDVLKVAGHRLSTAEIESAINQHESVTESAVVGFPHAIKGEVPLAFVIVKEREPDDDLVKELIQLVDKVIGPTARPEKIVFADDLPKTRSGKIMRRILKRIAQGEDVGDITTLSNPEVVALLKEKVIKKQS